MLFILMAAAIAFEAAAESKDAKGAPEPSGAAGDADLNSLLGGDAAPAPGNGEKKADAEEPPQKSATAPNGPAAATNPSPAPGQANAGAEVKVPASATLPVDNGPATSAEARPRAKSALMEEIVVTAQKREENVQDVPIAVNAFNGDQLKALGVSNPYDLSAVVPGLQATSSVGFAVTYLRGVGSDAFLMGDPSVALYIDDVYLPFANAANQKFGELERTEVLKGPQGTLFGRNAVGGAINVVTKRPDFDKPAAAVDLEEGNYNLRSEKVFFNVPVTSRIAFNFTALQDQRNSYYVNSVDDVGTLTPAGTPVPGEKSTGFQLKARVMPFDWMDVNLNVSTVRDRGSDGLYAPNTDPSPLAMALGITAQPGFNNIRTNEKPTLGVLNNIASGNIKLHWDWFDMKLLASDQRIRADSSVDFDGSAEPIAGFTLSNEFGHFFTSEVQLLSNSTSWDAEKLQWIVGGYYFNGSQGLDPVSLYLASTNLAQGRILGIQVPPELLNLLDQTGIGSLLPAGSVTATAILGTLSLSGYFQTTYHFTDWVALTLGGRYQSETRKLLQSTSNLVNADGSTGLLLFESPQSQFPPITTTRFSPKISLEFRPFDNFLAYASYQTATKSATYNSVNIVLQATKIKPEQLDAYELGVKSEWLDGLLKLNGAVFKYKQKDLQVQFVSLLTGGAVAFQNAPRASVFGSDFDAVANLFPSYLDGLYLTASGAYLDSHFTDYPNCDGFDPSTGLFTSADDCTGKRITRSPKLSGRAGLNKIFAFDNSKLEVAGDIYYNSGYFVSALNDDRSHQPTYKIVNGRVGYSYDPFNLNVSAYVRNILNQQYAAGKLDTDFGALTSLAAPRTYGVQLSFSY